LNRDFEASQYDVGTTSIRLIRVGNVVQLWFSSALEARYLYKELAERYRRAEERLSGGR
jgi:hypothetical protein